MFGRAFFVPKVGNSMENLTEEERFLIANKTSAGLTMDAAKAMIAAQRLALNGGTADVTKKPRKMSASERKAEITAQILAIGGEPPDASQSVAKFVQALTAAKSAAPLL